MFLSLVVNWQGILRDFDEKDVFAPHNSISIDDLSGVVFDNRNSKFLRTSHHKRAVKGIPKIKYINSSPGCENRVPIIETYSSPPSDIRCITLPDPS